MGFLQLFKSKPSSLLQSLWAVQRCSSHTDRERTIQTNPPTWVLIFRTSCTIYIIYMSAKLWLV